MNIYQKVAAARVRFQDQGVKMSGKNTFAGYTYFELSDILPAINRIGNEMGFICRVSFEENEAVLQIINMDDPKESMSFHSPMSTAALKGCHEVQNLGAVETYIKRYLYQNAFEIVECDALNGTQGKHEPEPKAESSREYIDLKAALIDYLNAGMFDHPENVEKVIDAKDLTNMRKALDAAKAKEKAAQKKVGE
jgi:hypothetical protein